MYVTERDEKYEQRQSRGGESTPDERFKFAYYVYITEEIDAWGRKKLKHHLVRCRWLEGESEEDGTLSALCQHHEIKSEDEYELFGDAITSGDTSLERLCGNCAKRVDPAGVQKYREIQNELDQKVREAKRKEVNELVDILVDELDDELIEELQER